MANPVFKFTLSHDSDTWEISEPIGWLDSMLRLERHEDYHSLIEYFTGSFIFYGDNGVDDGGLDIIRSIEQEFGPDATLIIQIDISFDSGIVYENVFTGQLDITSIQEDERNQAEVAIIRDDFWAKFIARKDTPVDLQATIDLDQNSIIPITPATINLISQIVDKTSLYTGDIPSLPDDVYVVDLPDGNFIESAGATEVLAPLYSQVAQDREQREIEDSFALPMVLTEDITLIFNLIELTNESGLMAVDIQVPTWSLILKGQLTMISVEVDPSKIDSIAILAQLYVQKNADTPTLIDTQSFSNTGPANPASTVIDRFFSNIYELPLSGTFSDDLIVTDKLTVYIKYTITFNIDIGADTNSIQWVARSVYLAALTSTVTFNFKSVYRDNAAQGFLLHDAGAAILNSYGLGESNPFYSNILGSFYTNAREYPDSGCDWTYIVLRGLQARTYTLTQKPFAMSFDDWWKGANPILNLGLGYENINIPEQTVPQPDRQFIIDSSFDDSGEWPQIGSGDDWTISSGEASVILTGASSKSMHQTFIDAAIGNFDILYFRQSTGLNVGVDSINLAITLYDEFGVAVGGLVEFISGNISGGILIITPTTGVPVEVRITALQNSGGGGNRIVMQSVTITGPSQITIPAQSGQVIEVEAKSEFYDPGATSIDFDYVINISRKYDDKIIFNKIEIGYTQWKSEDISGIDDPQTQHTYATRFQKIGDAIQLFSSFIAASLALEITRRQSIVKSQDYKYDDNTFIVSVVPDEIENTYNPELDENFNSVTNLLNEETRYNKRLTPARNLLRWIDYLNIALQSYLTSLYKFVKGEGNYDMVADMDVNECGDSFDGDPLSEKQDIPVTSDYLHDVRLYTISMPMEWEQYNTIRQNRKKAIGISQSDVNHKKFYIHTLEYKPAIGSANIIAWPKEYFEITQTDFVKPNEYCQPEPPPDPDECDTETSRVTDDDEFRVTTDGECRETL